MFRTLLIGVAVIGLSIGGSFVAGLTVGRRSAPPPQVFQSGPGPGGAVLSASATIGTISRVEGKTVYVKAPDGKETKVTLTDQTRIQKQVDGTAADLQPGANVTVRPEGQPGSDGSVTAAAVALLPEDGSVTFRGPGGQSATAGTRVGGR